MSLNFRNIGQELCADVTTVQGLCDDTAENTICRDKNHKTAWEAAAVSAPSWLAVRLLQMGINADIVKECDAKLVIAEGFTLESDFAQLPADKLTSAYLTRIGISTRGRLRLQLIALHKKIQAQYSPDMTTLQQPLDSSSGDINHRWMGGVKSNPAPRENRTNTKNNKPSGALHTVPRNDHSSVASAAGKWCVAPTAAASTNKVAHPSILSFGDVLRPQEMYIYHMQELAASQGLMYDPMTHTMRGTMPNGVAYVAVPSNMMPTLPDFKTETSTNAAGAEGATPATTQPVPTTAVSVEQVTLKAAALAIAAEEDADVPVDIEVRTDGALRYPKKVLLELFNSSNITIPAACRIYFKAEDFAIGCVDGAKYIRASPASIVTLAESGAFCRVNSDNRGHRNIHREQGDVELNPAPRENRTNTKNNKPSGVVHTVRRNDHSSIASAAGKWRATPRAAASTDKVAQKSGPDHPSFSSFGDVLRPQEMYIYQMQELAASQGLMYDPMTHTMRGTMPNGVAYVAVPSNMMPASPYANAAGAK